MDKKIQTTKPSSEKNKSTPINPERSISRSRQFFNGIRSGLEKVGDRLMPNEKILFAAMAAVAMLSTEAVAGIKIITDTENSNISTEPTLPPPLPPLDWIYLDDIQNLGGSVTETTIPDEDMQTLDSVFDLYKGLLIHYLPPESVLDRGSTEPKKFFLTRRHLESSNYKPLKVDGVIVGITGIPSEKNLAVKPDQQFYFKVPNNETGLSNALIAVPAVGVLEGTIYQETARKIADVSGYRIEASDRIESEMAEAITTQAEDFIAGIERAKNLFQNNSYTNTIRFLPYEGLQGIYSSADEITMTVSISDDFLSKKMTAEGRESVAAHEAFHHIDHMLGLSGIISEDQGQSPKDATDNPLYKLFNEVMASPNKGVMFFYPLNEGNFLSDIPGIIGGHTESNPAELFATTMNIVTRPDFLEIIDKRVYGQIVPLYHATNAIKLRLEQMGQTEQNIYPVILEALEAMQAKIEAEEHPENFTQFNLTSYLAENK